MKKQTNYNQLVGKKNDTYYFCDYIFEGGNFCGGVGTLLQPVNKSDYEERTDPNNAQDYFDETWREAVHDGRTENSLAEFTKWILLSDGDEAIFDFSGYDLWDELRETVPKLTEEDYPVFECIGGGRCFESNMEWDEVYALELWEKIKAIEQKNELADG